MPSLLNTLRAWLIHAPRAQRVDLHGKQILVTGTAPGSIGFETARILASWGAQVTVTTRSHTEAVAEQLRQRLQTQPDSGTITAHPLDLADTQSVDRFVSWYSAHAGKRLDVLINNAGIHLDLLSQWKQPTRSADGHEIHWRTNTLGTLHLTHGLLPLLLRTGEQTGDARIVNVVSELHKKGRNDALFAPLQPYNSWVAYGTSKLALVHATFELQRRYAASHLLQAYCLHPGAVFTNIADKGLSGNPLLERIRKACAPIERFFLLTPEEGAQTTVHCATAADAVGGQYYRACKPAAPSAQALKAEVSERLWERLMVEPDERRDIELPKHCVAVAAGELVK